MDADKKIIIPFKGLKEGGHMFDFLLTKTFFEHLEYSEISLGEVKVQIELTKRERLLELGFDLHGWVEITCDRCLELFKQPVDFEDRLFVKFGEEAEEMDDNVIVLSESDHELDLTHHMYESVMLSLPVQRVHPDEDDCNQEMLERMYQQEVGEKENDIDPRWDQLKDLLKNKN